MERPDDQLTDSEGWTFSDIWIGLLFSVTGIGLILSAFMWPWPFFCIAIPEGLLGLLFALMGLNAVLQSLWSLVRTEPGDV